MKEERLLILVPTKLCSRRMPLKNMRALGNKLLFCYCLDELLVSSSLFSYTKESDIIVATESTSIMGAVESKYDGRVKHFGISVDLAKRGQVIDVALHVLSNINKKYTSLMLVQPNLPFVSAIDYYNAYMLFVNGGRTAVQSIERVEYGVYQNNGAVFVADVGQLLGGETRFVEPMNFFLIPEDRSLEIDTEFDFRGAECMMKGNKR